MQPYRDLTAALEDFQTLKALHYDDMRQQFLDYGDHSEDVSLQVGTPKSRSAICHPEVV